MARGIPCDGRPDIHNLRVERWQRRAEWLEDRVYVALLFASHTVQLTSLCRYYCATHRGRCATCPFRLVGTLSRAAARTRRSFTRQVVDALAPHERYRMDARAREARGCAPDHVLRVVRIQHMDFLGPGACFYAPAK